MSLSHSLLMELDQEAKSTRALLERVPDDKLTWKPHEKSMCLGELANHVATVPARISTAGTQDSMALEDARPTPQPESTAAILAAFDESLAQAKAILGAMNDDEMMKPWSLTRGGQPVFSLPRLALFRSILLNHLYHHRGQLTVYLRLLDVPLPSVYGPTADSNPFA